MFYTVLLCNVKAETPSVGVSIVKFIRLNAIKYSTSILNRRKIIWNVSCSNWKLTISYPAFNRYFIVTNNRLWSIHFHNNFCKPYIKLKYFPNNSLQLDPFKRNCVLYVSITYSPANIANVALSPDRIGGISKSVCAIN